MTPAFDAIAPHPDGVEAADELIHERAYVVRAYRHGPDHLILRGSVRDQKPPGLYIADDDQPLTIHHMIVDLTIALPSLQIVAAKAVLETHPHPTCKRIEDHYDKLVGLSIARGYTNKIRELFGGPRGCTHTTALLQAMAPVAIQSIWSVNMSRPRSSDDDTPFSTDEARMEALMANTNSCHVWAEDGEHVASLRDGSTDGRAPVDHETVRRARARPCNLALLIATPGRLAPDHYTAAVADTTARTSDPWVESPWIEQDIIERRLSPEMAAIARHYHTEGFAVIPGLIDPDLLVRVLEDLIEPLHEVNRVQDAWKFSTAVRELALMPPVLDVLRILYGREPVPFQTLNFEYGTQQRAHSDTVHFSSLPRRYMCGAWVALEDVDAGNGPLFYYPGSQRLPDPFFQRFGLDAGIASYVSYEGAQEALLEAHGLEPIEFHAKAGDVLIWSANLVHGGKPITEDGRTRWSQVTHYFFDGCVYVTPLHSDPEVGEWFVRADLENIATGRLAPQSYNHEPVHFEDLGNGRSRIHRGVKTAPFPAEILTELRSELESLRRQSQANADELVALRNARAMRVGNAVLDPLRWIRRRLRR